MDWSSWADLWVMILFTALTPIFPVLPIFAGRWVTTAYSAAHHPWWIVLLIANLAGLPSMMAMVAFVRGAGRLTTWALDRARTMETSGRLSPIKVWIRGFAVWTTKRLSKIKVPEIRGKSAFATVFILDAGVIPAWAGAIYAGTTNCPWKTFVLAVFMARFVYLVPNVLIGSAYSWYQPFLTTFWKWCLANPIWPGTVLGLILLLALYYLALCGSAIWLGHLFSQCEQPEKR